MYSIVFLNCQKSFTCVKLMFTRACSKSIWSFLEWHNFVHSTASSFIEMIVEAIKLNTIQNGKAKLAENSDRCIYIRRQVNEFSFTFSYNTYYITAQEPKLSNYMTCRKFASDPNISVVNCTSYVGNSLQFLHCKQFYIYLYKIFKPTRKWPIRSSVFKKFYFWCLVTFVKIRIDMYLICFSSRYSLHLI